MNNFEKLYENVMTLFDESNAAGAGGVFDNGGASVDNTFNNGFSGDNYAPGDARNVVGTDDKKKKKGKKKKKKDSKFPWLQRRNLTWTS